MSIFDAIGGAVSDLFGANADQAKAQASEAQANAARVGAQADILKSQGDILEGEQYGKAASLADLNAQYTARSTAIQQAQADRQLYGVLGQERADIAASGFGEGGSAGDILRSSASQGALNRAVLGQQGLITEAGYQEQAQSYRTLQSAAGLASQEDILASQQEQFAAQGYEATAQGYRNAATGSTIGAIIHGVAAVADFATGNFLPSFGGGSTFSGADNIAAGQGFGVGFDQNGNPLSAA